MFFIIYLINISFIFSLVIPEVSLNSRVFLKDFYIPVRKRSVFYVKNYYGGDFYIQTFNEEIKQCFICDSREKALLNVYRYCRSYLYLEKYHDFNLGSFKFLNVYFVFLDENNEFLLGSVKIFNENSPYSIFVYNTQDFKCFDYFSGHYDMKINLYFNSNYHYNNTINIQYNSNLSYPADIRLINKNNSKVIFSSFEEMVNHDELLDHKYEYTLIYSPPKRNNIHSIFCLSFNTSEVNFVTDYSTYYQLIAPRYMYFYSYYQDYWKILGDSFITTFNFQFNSSQNINISYYIYINENLYNYYYDSLTKNENNYYNLSIKSNKNEFIILKLFVRPEILDNDCHNGKYFSVNKTISKIDHKKSLFDILDKINDNLIFYLCLSIIIFIILFLLSLPNNKCNNDN